MTRPTRLEAQPLRATVAAVHALLAALLVRSLVLAPRADAYIYWTNSNGAVASIDRANLDGRGCEPGYPDGTLGQ